MPVVNTVFQLIPNFYDNLLSEIFQAHNLDLSSRVEDRKRFLQSLRPFLRNLRIGFGNSEVTVRYSDQKIQLAYLLAYFPVYIETTFEVLCDSHQQLQKSLHGKDKITVALIGPGPCPEIIAMLLYVKTYFPSTKSIKFYICDINQAWRFSQDIVYRFSNHCELQSNTSFAVENIDFDVRHPDDWKKIQNKDLDLLISQNLINEISRRGSIEQTARNFINGIIGTAVNTEVFIIDFARYQVISDFKDKAHQILSEQGIQCIRRNYEIQSSLNSRTPPRIPPILDNGNFFDGNEFRARQNVNFTVLSFSLRTAEQEQLVKQSIDQLIKILQDEVAVINNRVTQISEEQVLLDQGLQDIQQTCGDTAVQLQVSNTKIQNLTSQYIALKQELKAVQNQEQPVLIDLIARVTLLESLRDELQGDLLSFKSILNETKNSLQQYDTQVKFLEELYQDLDLAVQERILPDHATMLDLCSDLEGRSKKLETQVSSLRNQISSLADESQGFSGNLELSKRELREQIDVNTQTVNDRLSKIESSLAKIQAQIVSKQSTDAQPVQQQVESLTQQVQLLQRDFTDIHASLELRFQDIQQNTNVNVRKVNTRFQKLEDSLVAVERSGVALKQDLSQSKLELAQMIETQIASQQSTEIQLAQQQMTILKKQVRLLKLELTNVQEGLHPQIMRLESKIRNRSILFVCGILIAFILSIFT